MYVTFEGLSIQEGFPPLELENAFSRGPRKLPVNMKVTNLVRVLMHM